MSILATLFIACFNGAMSNNFHDSYITKHSFLLLTVVGLVFLWAISPFQSYATQLVALLLAIFITKHIFRHHLSSQQESLLDSLILTALVLVIVTSSGGLSSPVFFLVYFLLFVLSLLLTPTIPLILSFSLVVYFLFSTSISSISQLLPLFSFPLITPMAVYFGREHQKKLYHKHDVYHLRETIRRETEDVLLWLTTTFTKEITAINDSLDKFPGINDLQKKYLDSIKKNTLRLKKLGDKLKAAIEED